MTDEHTPSPEAWAYAMSRIPEDERERAMRDFDAGMVAKEAVLVAESRKALLEAVMSFNGCYDWQAKPLVDALLADGTVQLRTPEDGTPNPILASFMRDVAEREGSWDPVKLLASWTKYVTNPPQLTSARERHTKQHVAEASEIFGKLSRSLGGPAGEWQEVPRG